MNPFGALDAQVRAELRAGSRKLHDTIHVTSIFVTHDQEEALEVAEKIVVMNRGVIEQTGTLMTCSIVPLRVRPCSFSEMSMFFTAYRKRSRGIQ
jgi:sulfate transport system ATP-binding protein